MKEESEIAEAVAANEARKLRLQREVADNMVLLRDEEPTQPLGDDDAESNFT